jgi:hypothetical protein
LLSSNTVFIDSIHNVSTGPSKITFVVAGREIERSRKSKDAEKQTKSKTSKIAIRSFRLIVKVANSRNSRKSRFYYFQLTVKIATSRNSLTSRFYMPTIVVLHANYR